MSRWQDSNLRPPAPKAGWVSLKLLSKDYEYHFIVNLSPFFNLFHVIPSSLIIPIAVVSKTSSITII